MKARQKIIGCMPILLPVLVLAVGLTVAITAAETDPTPDTTPTTIAPKRLQQNSTRTSTNRIASTKRRQQTVDYDAHANSTLQAASKRMQSIWNRKRDIFLSLSKGRNYNMISLAPLKQEIDNDYRRFVYELAANLSVIPVAQMTNPQLRRQVQRLSKLQLYGLRNADFESARELLHTMQTFMTNRMVCQRYYGGDCHQTVALVPTIIHLMMRTKSQKELDYYWWKWRQVLADNELARKTFIDYIRLLRTAATHNGHVTPSRTWYLHYDTDNFQRELEDVIWNIMPLYRELHAYLRHSARLTYGNQLTDSDGGLPAAVLEQMIHQAWYGTTAFRVPYPSAQLPQVQVRLEEVLVTPVKLNSKAAEYFESLGLKHMSSAFYNKYARRINNEETGPDCKSEVYYFPPDVALRYCPKLEYKKLMQMHGHMAELQYNLYRKELPFGLDDEPCPGFAAAIGEAAVLASGTPRHLHRLHILYDESLNEEQAMNRLFRLAVHTILAIPQFFINDKFLVDVLDRRIPSNEYNCAYWRMQYKYAGVVTRSKRDEYSFDPDYKFYKGLNPEKSSTMKFLSEVLGLEFYRAFCLASGQYRPGNPDYPLHNCDFYGSQETGEMLKKMMKKGSTEHWRDVMQIATGERKLSGRGVMEFFAPLFAWLKEKNKELGVEPGWSDDINCKSA